MKQHGFNTSGLHPLKSIKLLQKLLPIVIAAAIRGTGWASKSILCRCDNEAVVSIINSGTCKDPIVMCLIRCLYFIAAKFNLLIPTVHLAGCAKGLPDTLTRDIRPHFLTNRPQANHLLSQPPNKEQTYPRVLRITHPSRSRLLPLCRTQLQNRSSPHHRGKRC